MTTLTETILDQAIDGTLDNDDYVLGTSAAGDARRFSGLLFKTAGAFSVIDPIYYTTGVVNKVKIATVTIPNNYGSGAAKISLMAKGSPDSSGVARSCTLNIHVKQQVVFGSDPYVALSVVDAIDWPVGFYYNIVSNGGPTVVDVYAEAPSTYVYIQGSALVLNGVVLLSGESLIENLPAGSVLVDPIVNYDSVNKRLTFGKSEETSESSLPYVSHGSEVLPGVTNDLMLVATSSGGGVVIQAGGVNQLMVDSDGNVMLLNAPTSPSGRPAGTLWNNSGAVNIV